MLPESETYWRASPLVHAASAYLLDGDVGPARQAQVEATYLPAHASGNLFTLLRCITNLARFRATQGRLHQAALTYRKVLEEAPGGLHNLTGSAAHYFYPATSFGLGSLLYEWNNLEGAERHLLQGIGQVDDLLTADADMVTLGYACLARLRQAGGDESGALKALEDLAQLGEQRRFLPGRIARRFAEEARLRFLQGDLDAALRWAERSGLSVNDLDLPFPKETEYLILAQVMVARNRESPGGSALQEVIGLLDRLLQAAETGSRMGSVIEILSLRALALHESDDFETARGDIFRALRLAETEGFVRVFVDQGEAMQDLLLETAAWPGSEKSGSHLQHDLSRVLAAFPVKSAVLQRLPVTEAPRHSLGRAEVFTPRELEVLHLIAEGASNQEIAAGLVIAGPTVKRHISHIFDKLGVNSRTQAVAQARKMGLLP
jgi:LuxR family maltose regulon positive regulatory protein